MAINLRALVIYNNIHRNYKSIKFFVSKRSTNMNSGKPKKSHGKISLFLFCLNLIKILSVETRNIFGFSSIGNQTQIPIYETSN